MDFRLRTGAAARFLGMARQHVADLYGREKITSIRACSQRRLAPSELVKFASGNDEPCDNRALRPRQPFIATLPINPNDVIAKARENGKTRPRQAMTTQKDWAPILESDLDTIDVLTNPTANARPLRARSPFIELSLTPPAWASYAPTNTRTTSRTRPNLPTRHPPPQQHRPKTADHPNVAHTESRTPA